MLQYGTRFLPVCLILFSLCLCCSFRRNKRILREGWFKNAGITRVGGQTVFAHAKQRVNFEEYLSLFSVFVDIILYTRIYVYVYMLFSDESVEFLKRFFFFSIYYTIKMLRGLNNCTLMYYCLFLRFSMFVSLKYELKTRTSLLNFQKLNFSLSNCSRVTVTSFYLNNSFDKVKKLI